MAEIIKIPSKYIYDKKVNELAGNKIQAVEIQAKDISEITIDKQVADIEKSPNLNIGIVNSYVSESNPYNLRKDFKGAYFAEQSWGEKTISQLISGEYTFNSEINTDVNINFYINSFYSKRADITASTTVFNDYIPNGEIQFENIAFLSNLENFYGIYFDGENLFYLSDYMTGILIPANLKKVYNSNSGWTNSEYKTIFYVLADGLGTGHSYDFAEWLFGVSDFQSTTPIDEIFTKITVSNQRLYFNSQYVYDGITKRWNSGFYYLKNSIFSDNTKISKTALNWLKENGAGNIEENNEYNGYVSQYTYAGLKNYHHQFNFSIPLSIEGDEIQDVFNYPDMETTAIYNHYQYVTKVKSVYTGNHNYISNATGLGAYTISDFDAIKLISTELDKSDSLLSDAVNGYSIESKMGQVKRPDDVSAGQDISAQISLPNTQNFNSAKIIKTYNGYYFSVNVLCGVMVAKGDISANEIDQPLTEDDLINNDGYAGYLSSDKGILDIYEVTKLRIVFKGKVLTLDIKEKTLSFGDEEKNSSFSIKNNELLQTSNKTNSYNSLDNLGNLIINSYAKGKETVSLVCGVAKYYDLSENKILIDPTNENPNLPMIIPNNSIILPYNSIMSSDGKLINVPLSTNSEGTPKTFLVVGSELKFDGAIRQIIYGIEIFVPYITDYSDK